MKNKLLLGLSLVCLIACGTTTTEPSVNPSSTPAPTTQTPTTEKPTTVAPTSTPTTAKPTSTPTTAKPTTATPTTAKPTTQTPTTAKPTTQTPTTVPPTTQTPTTQTPTTVAPLTMSLLIDGAAKEDKVYEMYVYGTMQITPLFNDESRAEAVTYKATEKSMWGTSASYNVSIDANGLLTATGKASSITVTVTSASGLTDSFELKVIAKADANYNVINEKLVIAKTEESNKVSSATFKKNTTSSSSSISYTMSDNGSTTTTTTTNSVTTSKHEILNNENYYTISTDAEGNVTSAKKNDTKPSSFGKFIVPFSSMNSFSTLSETATYVLTQLFGSNSSVFNKAEPQYLEAEDKYIFNSKAVNSVGGTINSIATYEVEFDFDGEKLSSFKYDYKSYGSGEISNGDLIANPTPTEITYYEGTLAYEERQPFSGFDISSLYVTSYDVELSNENGDVGTEFIVGSKLSFNYANLQPSTANGSIDGLSFKSSSVPSVANIGEDGKIECLSAGTTVLTFTSASGVEKEVTLTVKFDGIEGVAFSNELTSVTSIKVAQSITFTANTIPNSDNEVSVSIIEGSEFASLTNENGTYTLTGLAAGNVTIKASSTFNGQEFTCEHTLEVIKPLTTEEVIKLFEEYVFESEKNFSGQYNKLDFKDGKGTFTDTYGGTITFDYEVNSTTITFSNVVSSSNKITSIELADDGSYVIFTTQPSISFGAPVTTSYTLNKVKRPIEILDEDPDSDFNWGSLN